MYKKIPKEGIYLTGGKHMTLIHQQQKILQYCYDCTFLYFTSNNTIFFVFEFPYSLMYQVWKKHLRL